MVIGVILLYLFVLPLYFYPLVQQFEDVSEAHSPEELSVNLVEPLGDELPDNVVDELLGDQGALEVGGILGVVVVGTDSVGGFEVDEVLLVFVEEDFVHDPEPAEGEDDLGNVEFFVELVEAFHVEESLPGGLALAQELALADDQAAEERLQN